jgi:hypothetical protein
MFLLPGNIRYSVDGYKDIVWEVGDIAAIKRRQCGDRLRSVRD